MGLDSTPAVRDEAQHPTITRIRTVSHLLDELIRIPGTSIRFGLDPVLGLLPVLGDSVATLFSAYILVEAYRAGAPATLLVKMVLVLTVDTVVGAIPVLGSIFDTFWKANTWNVNMLSAHLEAPTEAV